MQSMSSLSFERTARRALPQLESAGRDFTYLALGLPAGIVTFTVVVTGLALAGGLAVTLLGIPVLLGTLYACRFAADVERLRAAALLGVRIRGRERHWRGGFWQLVRTATTDPAAWRDVLWSALLLPVGIAGFTVAVSLWSTALGLLSSPLWYWSLPNDHDTIALLDDPSAPWALLRVAIGLALIPVSYYICRGLTRATVALARATLG
jgi:Putative sensor